MSSEDLDRLCARCGIETEYFNVWGERRHASEATRISLLRAMGVAVDSAADAAAALAEVENRAWRSVLPPVCVARAGAAPVRIAVTLPVSRAAAECDWVLELENGERAGGRVRPEALPRLAGADVAGEPHVRAELELPAPLPLGYHRFVLLEGGNVTASMPLIACPARCYQPPALEDGKRIWGPAIQLYALRSARNWGMGDFGDLERLAALAARGGAAIIGVNPLHALFPARPYEASPYRPTSRSWLNVLYLDPERTAEFDECIAARELVQQAGFQARLQALRAAEMVDYPGSAAAKFEVLELLYAHFRERHLARETDRARAFRAFQRDGGERLRQHALFEALHEHLAHGDPAIWGWPLWPAAYRDPASAAVAAFARDHAARVEYFQYLQWQADEQLAAAVQRARARGLAFGIYQDLAVGVNPGGSETWMQPGLHALAVRVGCPPDAFNLKGQEWGLPPWIPQRLAEDGYAPFVETLRRLMRHAGALRLDHVMGLMRLYWIPVEGGPADGTYVNYAFSDLLGILALESERSHCLIVGEDLGTVPDAVRAAMAEYGMLAYRPMIFEREWNSEFRPPEHYLRQAVVTISTHDLPTLRGYWLGADLETRTTLDLFPTPEMRTHHYEERARDRGRLVGALARAGLLPEGATPEAADLNGAMATAVHAWVARAPSKILMVQLEDLLGQVDQVNLPGTTEEQYPNWRRKLPGKLEDWASDERVAAVLEALRVERGQKP